MSSINGQLLLTPVQNPLEYKAIANTGSVKVYAYFDIKDTLFTNMFSSRGVHRLKIDLKNGNTYSRSLQKQSIFLLV